MRHRLPGWSRALRAGLLPVVLLALLAAQQGAWLHALGHRAHVQPTQQTQADGHDNAAAVQAGAEVCDDCLAFAHLADVARADAGVLRLPAARFDWVDAPLRAGQMLRAPPQRSRGPPLNL